MAVGTFPQAYINWPLVVGDKQGYFSAAGLKVDTKELPAVSTLLQALSTGQLNVVMTTPDTSMNAIYSGAPLT
ncbi:MAG TPA: ABC transporter substrate-binding protein, partial [Chloroflexota bacterium]|nr:ABC transporter substrate-binding protein [Chloroflexota bacterium]